jgi:hypothetical protein
MVPLAMPVFLVTLTEISTATWLAGASQKENAELAEALISQTLQREKIPPGQLTLHAGDLLLLL